MSAARTAFPALALAVVGLGLVALLGGCSPHLVGTNDAALDYTPVAVAPGAGVAPTAPEIAMALKTRLSAAQVTADVEATAEGAVRVVVDADAAGAVEALALWRGGLGVYRVDDAVVLTPADAAGLRPMTGPPATPGRPEERWWQGPSDAVGRAAREAKLDDAHTALAERLPDGQWRTRVVQTPAVVTLGVDDTAIASIALALRGRALAFTFAKAAVDALAAERAAHPGERVVLARDRTHLATLPIDEAAATPLVVSFGDDVSAYTRAAHVRSLLETPTLPALRRTALTRIPPDYALAAACAVLPFLLSFGWLFFVRRFDRARPEPMWLVLATFALGGLSVIPAGLVEAGYAAATPWLDPSVMTFGGQLWALPIAIAVFTLVVGLSEEGAKFLGAWSLSRHRKEFDEPVDGIIYGCAAALGFAAVENVKYFAIGRLSGSLVTLRAFVTVPAHLFFGAIWGYAMGRELVSRRTNALEFLALAALVHGTFDAVLSIDGMQYFATAFVLVLAFAFVAMLRSALRFGAVPPERARADAPAASQPLPASDVGRAYFRVGSPVAFFACSAGIIVSAFALMVLGSAYEILHHRIGVVFVSLATAMLSAFGAAAYGASETIPLDVAVDGRGVTLAGAETPWSTVVGVDVEPRGSRSAVVLRTTTGSMRLGPTSALTAATIAEVIRAARSLPSSRPMASAV